MSPWFSDLFLSSQSDERLVRLAQTGHQQAFTAIVSRYRRELNKFANRLCPEGKAEDVVQQTFLSAFAALQNDCEVKHLRGWLYAIVRHHAVRVGTRGKLETELADAAVAGVSLEETVGQRMAAFEALSQIDRLPENQRAALLATALEGRSRAEVASLLGLSEGAVRQLVHRARSTVRAAVTAITPFPLMRWVSVRARTTPTTTAELVAGAGGAGTGAIVVKIGAVVVAGVGVAGMAGLRPRLGHRSTPTVRIAPADPRLAQTGSAPALAGFDTPLGAGTPATSAGQPGASRVGPRGGGDPRGGHATGGPEDHPGGSDGSGRSGDSGQSGSSGGLQEPGSGDGDHGGPTGSSGSGDSGSSNGGSVGGGGTSSSGSGGGSGSDGGSVTISGSSGSGSSGSGSSDGGGGGGTTTTTSGGGTTTTSTTGSTDGGSSGGSGGSDGGSGSLMTDGGGSGGGDTTATTASTTTAN